MLFCIKCFIDPEIIGRIKYNSGKKNKEILSKGECPLCKSKNVHLYDTNIIKILDDIFDPILDLYTTEDKLPKEFPENEKRYLCEDIYSNWNLFNHNMSEKDIESIIKETSKEYSEKQDIFSKKVGLPDKINKNVILSHALIKSKDWSAFVEEIKTKNRFHSDFINEDVLKRYCLWLMKKYKKGQKFYRGRISKSDSGFDVSEMGAPPFELAKSGRANAEGISHLYLANDKKTTIHEIRAGAYDIITVGAFELQNDIVVVDFQMLNRLSPFVDNVNLNEYAINIDHLKKMNQDMSKTLRRDDSPLDYIPTQLIADYIKSFCNENSNRIYRGIEYQSTMNKDGYNLVAFYPDDFKCISVETVTITDIKYRFQ